VTYVAEDWREVRVTLPLNWRTRNYVDVVFGGSIYGAVDPIYMMMLIQILGEEFTVWDKAARIRFQKPGDRRLFARFHLPEAEIEAIRSLDPGERSDREYLVRLVDADGESYATVEKTVYVRRDS
jgi:acyl-coenzyme A thioesterase PaaI-like protein